MGAGHNKQLSRFGNLGGWSPSRLSGQLRTAPPSPFPYRPHCNSPVQQRNRPHCYTTHWPVTTRAAHPSHASDATPLTSRPMVTASHDSIRLVFTPSNTTAGNWLSKQPFIKLFKAQFAPQTTGDLRSIAFSRGTLRRISPAHAVWRASMRMSVIHSMRRVDRMKVPCENAADRRSPVAWVRTGP